MLPLKMKSTIGRRKDLREVYLGIGISSTQLKCLDLAKVSWEIYWNRTQMKGQAFAFVKTITLFANTNNNQDK